MAKPEASLLAADDPILTGDALELLPDSVLEFMNKKRPQDDDATADPMIPDEPSVEDTPGQT